MRDAGTGGTESTEPGGRGAVDWVFSVRRHSGRALRMAFVLDVAGYGRRTPPDRDAVQQRLRRLVVATLAECGLKLDQRAVDHQWTGDGINAILPADIDPTAVLTTLIRSLAAGLGRDNARHADRIRLRMAVGVGLFERSPAGFGGPVIVDINRLVDSAALRSALAGEPAADLAAAISDQAHALIIEPGYPGIPAGQFARVYVVSKEFSGPAWIWVGDTAVERARVPAARRDRPARIRPVPARRAARRGAGRSGVPGQRRRSRLGRAQGLRPAAGRRPGRAATPLGRRARGKRRARAAPRVRHRL